MERRNPIQWAVLAGRAIRNRLRDLVDQTHCRKTVYRDPDTDDRAKRINAACPGCVCETVSVGRHGTPGPVRESELLNSILIAPTDFNGAQIAMTLLTHAEKKGMSVMRDRASDDEIKKIIKMRIKDSTKQRFHGVAQVSCAKVRSLHATVEDEKRASGERYFMVLDADMAQLPNHADIFVTQPKPHEKITDKAVWRKERAELFKLMYARITPADDFRSGSLS